MIGLDIDNSVIVEQKRILEQALSTNPKTQKALQKLIDEALKEIKPEVISSVRASLGSDPRGAANGIRRIVYKKILGGNINILNPRRKARGPISYEPPRKLQPGQRGGNRVPRSRRTNDVMHYGPIDRQWILRIVNSGTTQRMAGTRNGHLSGNRGSISARNFFGRSGIPALMKAADNLAVMIDTEIQKILDGKS